VGASQDQKKGGKPMDVVGGTVEGKKARGKKTFGYLEVI